MDAEAVRVAADSTVAPGAIHDEADVDIEIALIVEGIYRKYHYDFRAYAPTSLKRRLVTAMQRFGCGSLSRLQERVIHEPELFPALLDVMTVQVSDMFRDPAYFKALRTEVVPMLRTYPSLKVWVAGCSMGEEAYSLAILLKEEGLLDRTQIYATDINPHALEAARAGVYAIERVSGFTENHRRSGARSSLSDHYVAAYDRAVLDKSLRARIVFSDHSLATDSVFGEMQLVSCRNVLIYFSKDLQDRAIGLFRESLCRKGYLGIGSKESLRFSADAAAFDVVSSSERIYQKRAER